MPIVSDWLQISVVNFVWNITVALLTRYSRTWPLICWYCNRQTIRSHVSQWLLINTLLPELISTQICWNMSPLETLRKKGSVTFRMSSWGLCISDQQDEIIYTPVDIDLCSENKMAHEYKFNAVAQLGLQMIEYNEAQPVQFAFLR